MGVPIVLVHSPLVGPGTWRAMAVLLEGRGWRCATPDLRPSLLEGPPFAARQLGIILEDVDDEGTILVGHSGAGPLVARAAVEADLVAGCVLVDALLPSPGIPWMQTLPAELAAALRGLAHEGWLAPWPQWWGPGELEALVADAVLRATFVEDCPRLPVAMLDEPQPPGDRWRGARAAYLRLSDAYEAEAEAARSLGWPVLEHAGHHLEVLTAPERVVEPLLELVADLVS